MKIIDWAKQNKLTAVLLISVVYLLYSSFGRKIVPFRTTMVDESFSTQSFGAPSAGIGVSEIGLVPPIPPGGDGIAADVPLEERKVVQNSNLSLLVSDVRVVSDQIIDFSEKSGGFMVSTSFNRPEESAFATVTVRVPTERFNDALNFFRSLAVKVTNENLQGTDITEQYVDIDARITTLEKTKAKFDQILDTATRVQDILQVQREIINTQSQIDRLVGQRKAIEENVALTKITVYLSTDELALPYTPDKAFRPNVIFKLAVRSVIGSLRGIAEKLIWIAVYSVIWIPAVIIVIGLKRYLDRRKMAG